MSKPALLAMDLQNSIVSRYASNLEVIAPFQRAIEAARTHNIPVIYVRVGFMEGYPEVHPRNKMFGRLVQSGIPAGGEGMQIHDAVKPQPGEPVITKVRVSAFAGSTLESILRAQEIDTLILSGISTSGVVLSTVREAADKDFAITVLSDACLDLDPEVHGVLMDKVFSRQADVMTVEAWAGSLA